MTTAIALPPGLPRDAAPWAQPPLVVRPGVVQLLAVIPHQAARIAPLDARVSQTSRTSERPPASDPPVVTHRSSATTTGTPGAQSGHPGPHPVLVTPTEVSEVNPAPGGCGPRERPTTTPHATHQVIEPPERQIAVTPVVLHETRCPRGGRLRKAELPAEDRYGYGPRVTARIGERSGGQRDSRTAGQALWTSVLGVPISRGAMQRTSDRVSEAISPHAAAIAEEARRAKATDIDETAW